MYTFYFVNHPTLPTTSYVYVLFTSRSTKINKKSHHIASPSFQPIECICQSGFHTLFPDIKKAFFENFPKVIFSTQEWFSLEFSIQLYKQEPKTRKPRSYCSLTPSFNMLAPLHWKGNHKMLFEDKIYVPDWLFDCLLDGNYFMVTNKCSDSDRN